MSSYLSDHGGTRSTPQSEPIPGTDQVPNAAGGHAWAVSPMQRLRRFLILGTEGGTFYTGQRELTRNSITALRECLEDDYMLAIGEIALVSQRGLARRNDEALYALAVAASHRDQDVRATALSVLPTVARTGTHLFQFVAFVETMRGWGPALKRAVAQWYITKDPATLAYQLAKYQGRNGWTTRDVLRLAKPRPPRGSEHDRLLAWAVGKSDGLTGSPLVDAMVELHRDPTEKRAIAAITAHGLSREMLPSELLTRPAVWEAMLDRGMPMTALVRNLANLTRIGLIAPLSQSLATVTAQLTNADAIRKARVHPLSLLMAHRTYLAGHGTRGTNTWTPVAQVADALDAAFYLAFENVPSTGKRTLLALDVSGSMTGGHVAGVIGLSPRDASAAMALVTAAAEPQHAIVGFTSTGARWSEGAELTPLAISPKQRLADAVRVVSDLPFGGTDCALPMLWALETGALVDTFVIYTDSETWAGRIHPAQALAEYRRRTGIAARLIVVGMVSNGFTIADPADPGMLDVVGFDASTPALIGEFSRGAV